MSDHTKIEWCDATLNLWWGCTKVSDGCKNCYAEHLADQRYHKGNWGPKGTRKEVKSWRATLNQISKRAKTESRRLKVFVSSMSDIFEGPETMGGEGSENWATVSGLQTALLEAIRKHPELDFLILTKRPENILPTINGHNQCCRDCGVEEFAFPPNAWFGTSVENQKAAEERIPHLLGVPAAVRFLSCEPLIGRVELCLAQRVGEAIECEVCGCRKSPVGRSVPPGARMCSQECPGYLQGVQPSSLWPGETQREFGYGNPCIDWVICGGESGPNARPMHPDWARSLRDQCADAGVAFFFKQWGEFAPSGYGCGPTPDDLPDSAGFYFHDPHPPGKVWRFGKKAAGRLLNGQEHNAFPEVNQ